MANIRLLTIKRLQKSPKGAVARHVRKGRREAPARRAALWETTCSVLQEKNNNKTTKQKQTKKTPKTEHKKKSPKKPNQLWSMKVLAKGDVHVYTNIKTDMVDAGIQWDVAIPGSSSCGYLKAPLSHFGHQIEWVCLSKGAQSKARADLCCPPATNVVQMKVLLSFLINIYHPKVRSWQWIVVSSHEKAQIEEEKTKILNKLLKKKKVVFFFS